FALFRELFPGETLAPGSMVSVANVTLMVTALDRPGNLYEELGDAGAFALMHEQFRFLTECVRREGGALVKTVGEGVVAVFAEPVAAVRAALQAARRRLAANQLRTRVAVHRGPALAATINDHLDYFGTTVSLSMQLPGLVRGGEVVLTQPVA